MSDEAAFLRAIQADPTDATAKLVYADWLDEHGEPERAEYLRLLASGETSHTVLNERASRAGRAWAGLVKWTAPAAGTNRPAWDEATLYALGTLDGVLETYRAFNEQVSDIDIYFRASLVLNEGSIEDLCRANCPPASDGRFSVESLGDWATELTSVLSRWLFVERGGSRPHSALTIETEAGRANAVYEVIECVRDVLRPRRGWRVLIEPNGFYALDWADIALEAPGRVLFLHFSFSD